MVESEKENCFPFCVSSNQLQAVALHLTGLAKVNDAGLCSFQIFIATSVKFYLKERR